jgi:adenine-specific DNA-methyltransferase
VTIDGKLYKKDLQGTYWDFVAETKNLTKEGDTPLPNGKKPLALLRRLLELDKDNASIILDFFAGSGTTGHAVWMENLKDAGSRRFILVQLPERLDSHAENQKVASAFCESIEKPLTIAELTKERLRRAGTRIHTENPMFSGDTGFRVFKLDTTSIRPWDPTLPVSEQRLLGEVDNILLERTEQDLLYELLLKRGIYYALTAPIVKRMLSGRQVFAVSTGDLIACLAPRIETADVEPLAHGIVEWHKELAPPPASDPTAPLEKVAKVQPPLVVFRDTAFVDDVAKSNLTEILKQHGLTDVRSL